MLTGGAGREPGHRGRPREFCPDAALDRVLEVFWREGFEGASVQALADAAGVSKPSLYAAYGNKEAIYLAALHRYREFHRAALEGRLEAEPDVRVAIHTYLRSMVDSYTERSHPSGCLVVTGTSGCESDGVPDAVREALCDAVHASGAVLERRLARARDEDQLPPDVDVPALATYFSTLVLGMSVQARAGASRSTLFGVVDEAMARWG